MDGAQLLNVEFILIRMKCVLPRALQHLNEITIIALENSLPNYIVEFLIFLDFLVQILLGESQHATLMLQFSLQTPVLLSQIGESFFLQ